MEASDIIPTLRFPKSRGRNRWVVSTIGEIFESLPTASYSRAYLSEEGSIGYIHYGDIHTKYNSYIDLSKVKLPSIPVELKKKYRYVKDGDLVLTDASEDYLGIGKAVEIINVGKHKTICGLHTILLRETQHVFCVGFKTYLFQSPTVKKQIERLSVGFKVNSITFSTIKDIQIVYPIDKQEQDKISRCLQSVEALIKSNEDTLVKLYEHKKALLQNILPEDDKTIPVIRYPEFSSIEDWTILKLKDLVKRVTEKVGDRNIAPVSISAGGGFVSQTKRFGRNISGEQYQKYIVLQKGDFAYNKGNSIKYPQGCIYKLKCDELVAVPYVFICFRLKKTFQYCADYIQWLFENNYHGKQLQKYISSGVRGNGLLNLSATDFFDLGITIPSNKTECQKIVRLLSSIDDILEGTKKKIELLKLQKKGLLQQLYNQK